MIYLPWWHIPHVDTPYHQNMGGWVDGRWFRIELSRHLFSRGFDLTHQCMLGVSIERGQGGVLNCLLGGAIDPSLSLYPQPPIATISEARQWVDSALTASGHQLCDDETGWQKVLMLS